MLVKRSPFFITLSALLLSALMMPSGFGLSAVLADNATPSEANDTQSTQPSSKNPIEKRSTLTGDWGGLRASMAGKGVTLDFRHTSFYQGLASGTGDEDFDYGGKFDAFINLDSGKMGLWKGGGFRSHWEYSHGNLDTNLGGALFATNTAMYWPVDTPGELVATSLYFTQRVGDKSSIALGKFNPVDLYATDPFYGGWGIDRYMNLILVAPPSGLIPVVFMGAVASIQAKPLSWTVMVFDPNDRTNDYLPGDLFEEGVNFSVGGTHNSILAGRKTVYSVTGLYSTAEGVDYSSIGGGIYKTTTKNGAWNLNFEFRHNLQEAGGDSNAAWGIYLKAAVADGNPNYVQRSLIAGIGGRALFFGRPQDSFGIGTYYYNLSEELQDVDDPTAIIGNEAAVELFYNYSVTPWLYLSPDIQYVKPARGRFDNALVLGLRIQVRF